MSLSKREFIVSRAKVSKPKYNDTDLSVVAHLIYVLTGNMDISMNVARQWQVDKFEIISQNTERSRRQYIDLLWLEKPGAPTDHVPHSLGEFAQNICLWNSGYINSRESMRNNPRGWSLRHRAHRRVVSPHKRELRYIATKKGIRSLSLRFPAVQEAKSKAEEWGIAGWDKDNITLKDKLNDIAFIPRFENQLLGIVARLSDAGWLVRYEDQ